MTEGEALRRILEHDPSRELLALLSGELPGADATTFLLEHLGSRSDDEVERSNEGLASDLRDLFDERRFEGITLAEPERILHASRHIS